jgi:hypothetical protein
MNIHFHIVTNGFPDPIDDIGNHYVMGRSDYSIQGEGSWANGHRPRAYNIKIVFQFN